MLFSHKFAGQPYTLNIIDLHSNRPSLPSSLFMNSSCKDFLLNLTDFHSYTGCSLMTW